MVKYVPNKRNLAIAIRENYFAGMKPKEIAKLFQILKQREKSGRFVAKK